MSAVAAPLRLVAAVRAGALLVARPRGVVHVAAAGPLTPSGRALPRASRTVCRGRTGRLYLFTPGVTGVAGSGRRFCRRCTAALPVSLGTAVDELRTRDHDIAAYGHLTADDLTIAASWCRTVEETHQVGRIGLIVLGPAPIRRDTPVAAFESTLIARRKSLAAAALSPEEREAAVAAREADVAKSARVNAGRAKQAVIDRITDRANRGHYLLPHERELRDSA